MMVQEDAYAGPNEFWTTYIQRRMKSTLDILPRRNSEARRHACQKIDEEVAAMRTVISTLLTHRNASCPAISVLPAEALGRIFQFHAAIEPPPPQCGCRTEHSAFSLCPSGLAWPAKAKCQLGWIRATHVCRFWRETAFRHPVLWSEIAYRIGEKWTHEMLTRAKSAPISYHQCSNARGTPPGDVLASRLIPNQLVRLRHLSMIDYTKTMRPIIQSMIDSPAPNLESLQLEDGSRRGIRLPSLFANTSPKLRRLELLEIRVPWSAPILRRLHHLRIELGSPVPAAPDKLAFTEYTQFFSTLQEMKDLRTLFLQYCLPVRPKSPTNNYSVDLPDLERLSLIADTAECVDVFRRITVPQSCRVVIGCDDFSLDHFQDMRGPLKSHMGAQGDQPAPLSMRLALQDRGRSDYLIHLWRSVRSPRPFDICPEPDFSLSVCKPDRCQLVVSGLKTLMNYLWVDSINTLVVDEGEFGRWKACDLIGAFQNLKLENLSLSGGTLPSFCNALATPIVKEGSNQSKQKKTQVSALTIDKLFLGTLKFVELSNADFNRTRPDLPLHEVLKTWLSLRREVGGTLPTLSIKNCTISLDKIEELKEMVKLDWDEIEVEEYNA